MLLGFASLQTLMIDFEVYNLMTVTLNQLKYRLLAKIMGKQIMQHKTRRMTT